MSVSGKHLKLFKYLKIFKTFHRKIFGTYWLLKHDKNMQGKDVASYCWFLVIVFVQALTLHNLRGDRGHTYFSE